MTPVGADRRSALSLLTLGWSVVPLHSVRSGRCTCGSGTCAAPGKHPHIHWEPFTDRLPLEEEVCRWWNRWPQANLGVVTGATSGVVVLDVDPRNGGDATLYELECLYGSLPSTVTALTGGGGRHFYFCHPGERVPCRPIARGLDLKGDGGLVVVPPSLHVSGGQYVWDLGGAPGERQLAEMPEWLVALARDRSVQQHADPSTRLSPLRTAGERREFAELWCRLGIQISEGDNYYLCPFHPDHHPSLHIDSEGCRFYCFGCTRGGGLGRLRLLAGSPSRRRQGHEATAFGSEIHGGSSRDPKGLTR